MALLSLIDRVRNGTFKAALSAADSAAALLFRPCQSRRFKAAGAIGPAPLNLLPLVPLFFCPFTPSPAFINLITRREIPPLRRSSGPSPRGRHCEGEAAD